MEIEISLGFTVVVNTNGAFELPNRLYTTAELKKITREINRALRNSLAENSVDEVMYDE